MDWRELNDSDQRTYVIGLVTQRDVWVESLVGMLMDRIHEDLASGVAMKPLKERAFVPMVNRCRRLLAMYPPGDTPVGDQLEVVLEFAANAHKLRNRVVHDTWAQLEDNPAVVVPAVMDPHDDAQWDRMYDPTEQRGIQHFLDVDDVLARAGIMLHGALRLVWNLSFPTGQRQRDRDWEVARGEFTLNADGSYRRHSSRPVEDSSS